MPNKRYDDAFKLGAARLVRQQGYAIAEAARNLGVDAGSIRRWVREFAGSLGQAADAAAPESPGSLERENARLREENRGLLMEREILKKAAAFFAKEST
jgi:transposase